MNFMNKLLSYGSIICFSLLSNAQLFSYEAKIIAVIDKKAITEKELEDRMRLVLFTSNQNDTPEMRNKMRMQILESMIVEKLQLKAATDGKVVVSKKDIQQAIENIASQNNMNHDQLIQMFKDNNISVQSLKDRLEAQLAWDAIIHYGLGGINVSEKEIDKVFHAENAADTIFDVSEIVLYPSDASKKAQTKKQAEDIVQQLKAGASFNALAQQFSQSTTARNGGHLGRLSSANLSLDLLSALNSMNDADVRIIEMPKGLQIIRLNNKNKITENAARIVSCKIALIPFDEDMPEEEQHNIQSKINTLRLSANISQFIKSASDMGFLIKTVEALDIEKSPSKEFAAMLAGAKVGDILKPIRYEEGLQVIYIVKKAIKQNQPLTRTEIKQQLEFQKKNMTAAMFLNKLRARTYIINNLSCG
jgi:peptidyl-prolyl cis-trans isomerase SurA